MTTLHQTAGGGMFDFPGFVCNRIFAGCRNKLGSGILKKKKKKKNRGFSKPKKNLLFFL